MSTGDHAPRRPDWIGPWRLDRSVGVWWRRFRPSGVPGGIVQFEDTKAVSVVDGRTMW